MIGATHFNPVSKRFLCFRTVGIVALACLVLEGCGRSPESSFSLASESRLPKWFSLSPNQERANVTVTMDYYIDPSGRTATFTLRDASGAVLSKVTGKQLGLEPRQRKAKLFGYPEGYPSYEIITVGGITEIVEHRKMEPVFYVTDDPAVKAELANHG
jgi:hypothetical protein